MASKKRKLKILFLDIFTDNQKLRKEIQKDFYKGGTYSDHVRKVFGLKKDGGLTVDASKNKFPKSFPQVDAMVIGGSDKNPVKGHNLLWMRQTYSFIKQTIKYNVPILGMCGGLQFVVKALGGEIIYNPKGREFGTVEIDVKRSDPLLRGLGKKFMAQSNHRCIVDKFDSPAKILASSKMSPIQVLAIGNNIRLVQFHPERRKQQTRAVLKEEKHEHYNNQESKNDYQKLLKSIKDTTRTDHLIISNFLKYFVYPRL